VGEGVGDFHELPSTDAWFGGAFGEIGLRGGFADEHVGVERGFVGCGGIIAEASGGGIADLLGEGGGVEAGAVAGFLDEEAAGIFAILEDDEVAVRAGDAAESGGGEFGGGDVGGNGWSGREAFRGWQGEGRG
jgi:hypothetical protein